MRDTLNIAAHHHQTRKHKPKKDALGNDFQVTVSKASVYLLACNIELKHIESWATEPWSYSNLAHALKWLNNYLLPEIEKLKLLLRKHTPEAWQNLTYMQRTHPDLMNLHKKKMDVKEMWFRRPRYPEDRGRFIAKGY